MGSNAFSRQSGATRKCCIQGLKSELREILVCTMQVLEERTWVRWRGDRMTQVTGALCQGVRSRSAEDFFAHHLVCGSKIVWGRHLCHAGEAQ